MEYFECNGIRFASIWHCFGNHMHRVDLPEVLRMLDASGTNVIPVNTHRLGAERDRLQLSIGFGDVALDDLREHVELSNYLLMANINHQTTAPDAVRKTIMATEMIGTPIVKIEVLQENLRCSNDGSLVEAVAKLSELETGLQLMPLVSNDLAVAKELLAIGCPLLRVMGGPIGSGSGIVDQHTFARICELGVPVVLDGGVGHVSDYALARDLGAAGCLVNSMLFEEQRRPHEVLADFVSRSFQSSDGWPEEAA